MHPRGGCAFTRNGTFGRVDPPGTGIARWYCPDAPCTFSLLPDCLASRLPGSLVELEAVVAEAEQARSVEAAANAVRTDDVGLPGAIRWTRRRIHSVHTTLTILIGLLPEPLLGCQPTVTAFRLHLEVECALLALREIAASHLPSLPPPLGLGPRLRPGGERGRRRQHRTGPDPPLSNA